MDDLRDPVARDDPRAEDAADPDLRRRDLEPSRETTRIRTAKTVSPSWITSVMEWLCPVGPRSGGHEVRPPSVDVVDEGLAHPLVEQVLAGHRQAGHREVGVRPRTSREVVMDDRGPPEVDEVRAVLEAPARLRRGADLAGDPEPRLATRQAGELVDEEVLPFALAVDG